MVTLRQLERQLARDKERAADSLRIEQEQQRQQVAKLQAQARALETERNLLMVSNNPLMPRVF